MYLEQNQFDLCITYVDKCLKGHKKSVWLKLEKADVLAMSGRIEEFYDFIAEIKNDKKVVENSQYGFIQNFEIVFSFLKQDEVNQPSKGTFQDNSWLYKIAEVIQSASNTEKNDIIPVALSLYNTKYSLYKSIVSLILVDQYIKHDDIDAACKYAVEAKKYAPSLECLYYLNEHESLKKTVST